MEYYSVLKNNSALCDNMDEPWGHYAKWHKPATKTNRAWFHLYEVSIILDKLTDSKSRMVVVVELGERELGSY